MKQKHENQGKVQVGKIYEATVKYICPWGVFVTVGSEIILIHCKEYSVCRFGDLQKIKSLKVGQRIKIKILKKTFDEYGNLHITASRKNVIKPVHLCPRQKIRVVLGSCVPAGDGRYCEVTPSIRGIIDIPPDKINNYEEGDKVTGIIKFIGKQKVKLRII